MDPVTEELPVPELIAEVVPETVPEPAVEGPKFRKVIQPKEEDGTPIGQPHVYEADTQEELDEKMAEAIANGTRKIRQLTRQTTLEPVSAVPEGATVEEEAPVWKPRPLTEEEKFIVKTDPEKAFDIQFEAKYGMTPERKAEVDRQTYENSKETRAAAEVEKFKDQTPGYFMCPENAAAMQTYMTKNKLAYVAKNLEIAFKELSAKGLLANKPEVPVPPVVARTEPQPAPRTSFPSAIRNNTASATVPIAVKKGPSAEEIAKMSSAEYKKLFPELHQAR